MSIRIGDSACFSRAMITPQARAVESRRYFDWNTEWLEIAEQCIRDHKFSITTICLNYFKSDNVVQPSEIKWRNWIENTVLALLAKGANWNNSRVDIINEPTKHCRTNDIPDVEKYLKLEHWAHDQIRGRLPMGSGCDELIYDTWQQNVVSRGKAEWYVIHIQATCDTKAKTDHYVNVAHNRAVTYGKPITCNEGNYKNVSSSSGFSLMKYQAKVAEDHGLPEYLNVFNDLDRTAFKGSTTQWDFLCFKIDGVFRNADAERHYNEWTGLMNSKAPVPNIIEIEKAEDGMIIKTIGLDLTDVKTGYGVGLLHRGLALTGYLEEENIDNYYKFNLVTQNAVKDFQRALKQKMPWIYVDGRVGRQTWDYLIDEIPDATERNRFWRSFEINMSPYNTKGST